MFVIRDIDMCFGEDFQGSGKSVMSLSVMSLRRFSSSSALHDLQEAVAWARWGEIDSTHQKQPYSAGDAHALFGELLSGAWVGSVGLKILREGATTATTSCSEAFRPLPSSRGSVCQGFRKRAIRGEIAIQGGTAEHSVTEARPVVTGPEIRRGKTE
jgi:hypothetical protein